LRGCLRRFLRHVFQTGFGEMRNEELGMMNEELPAAADAKNAKSAKERKAEKQMHCVIIL